MFVYVGERGSFTLGAAAARVPQSVASRRVATLERHLGERLFDRSAKGAVLTVFGRDMLPAAKRLVQLADALEYNAQQARLRPLTVAVPDACPVLGLAGLDAAAWDLGVVLDFRTAGPAERAELVRTREVRLALLAVPPDGATWTVPLGVASTTDTQTTALRIETLRPARTRRAYRRLLLQPEDDVPHVRDRLEQLGHRAALVPAQIAVAASLTAAVAETLRTDGLLLCSAAQAGELGLCWRPLAGPPVARGYAVAAAQGDDPDRITALWPEVARCLGAARRTGATT